uniref:Cyclic GMP-AMP synthase a n=1 Tax=Oryzias melastigma TaxID=30732 RepID=A0A3B3E0J9_ORYME
MSARRGSCKTRSPDSSEPATRTRQKQVPQPRCPAADKGNGTRRGANKQDQEKEKQSEKPRVEQREKTTKCFKERAGNSTEGTVASIAPTTTKSTKKSEKKTKKEDHNSVGGAVKSPETTRRVKTPEEAEQKTLKAKSKRKEETSSDMKEVSLEICIVESGKGNNERKAPKTKAERSNKEEPKEDPKRGKKTVAASEEDKVAFILRETLNKIRLKMKEKVNVSKVINDIKKDIIKHLKEKTQLFKEVQEPLNTGSYYENTKISNPDEFDVMLSLLVERVHIEPFKEDGAFYKVALKRGNNPLKALQEEFLPANKILTEFRKEVTKFLKDFKVSVSATKCWEMTPTKRGCPAVTLITKVESIEVSLDLVLCLQVKSSWPDFTKDGFKIEKWLGGKTRQEHRRKPFYLVPKYEGKDGWRISFSHIEKEILLNHGSVKTCCEKDGESCCRKACLKLLKCLLHLLKESDSSLEEVCSYHAKTTLFHACCDRTNDSDWKASDLRSCFQQFLQDFEGHLNDGKLQNFFVPGQNLLHGIRKTTLYNLAEQIKEQRLNGFPIFSKRF